MAPKCSDLFEAANRLRRKCYPLTLIVTYHDGSKDTLNDFVLAECEDTAIEESRRYIEGLDERGHLNLAKRVMYKLRNPCGELFYSNINA